MVAGLAFALVAALGYGAASVLQAVAASRTAAVTSLDPRLLVRVGRQLTYQAGLALDLAAFLASAVALHTLPLFVVQSVLASSVGVSAAMARALGVRLGRREKQALAVLAGGLVLLAVSGRPAPAVPLSPAQQWGIVFAVVPAAIVGLYGARTHGRRSAPGLAVAAGLAYSAVAVAARTLTVPHPWWHGVVDPALWALAANGALGTLLFAMALQRGSVTLVTAVTFVVDTVLPAAVGLAFLGDSARPGYAPVAALGFLLAISGALALSAYGQPTLPREP